MPLFSCRIAISGICKPSIQGSGRQSDDWTTGEHRLLHCNVIIELKNDEFEHEDLGQLNAYVGYYKKNEMAEGDNPPVGILLYTDKGSEMVEYALSGMDNQLFV